MKQLIQQRLEEDMEEAVYMKDLYHEVSNSNLFYTDINTIYHFFGWQARLSFVIHELLVLDFNESVVQCI